MLHGNVLNVTKIQHERKKFNNFHSDKVFHSIAFINIPFFTFYSNFTIFSRLLNLQGSCELQGSHTEL